MATKVSIATLTFAGVDYWDRVVYSWVSPKDNRKRYLCTVDHLYNGETPEQLQDNLLKMKGVEGFLYTKSPQTDFEGEPDFAIELVV